MTAETVRKILWRIILVALSIGLVGSVGFVVFRDYLSRFPTQWF